MDTTTIISIIAGVGVIVKSFVDSQEIKKILKEIRSEVKMTNGRVTRMEQWKEDVDLFILGNKQHEKTN